MMATLQNAIAAFLRIAGGGQSPATGHTYQAGLDHFTAYLQTSQGWGADTPLTDLSPESMWEYPAWLLKQTYRPSRAAAPLCLAESTRQLYLLAATRFLRFVILRHRPPLFNLADFEMVKDEFRRATNVKAEPISRKIPAAATVAAIVETARIPRTFNRLTAPAGRRRLTLEWRRNLAIILALKSSGMRVGELVSLKRGDLDYARQGAWVMGKGRRTRFIAFDDEAWAAIKEYLEQRNDEAAKVSIGKCPLFCRHDRHTPAAARLPMTTRAVGQLIKELVQKAAVCFPSTSSGCNNLHPHSFRHYFANKLLAYTGNLALVQDALGHSDPKTTRIYTEIKAEDIAWSIQALGAFTEPAGGHVFRDANLEHKFLTETYIPMLEKKLSAAQSRLNGLLGDTL